MRRWIFRWARFFPLAIAAFAALSAWARAGGGENYASGHSHESSSSSGDGGDLAALVLWLVFQHPAVGIPVLMIVVVVYVVAQRNGATARTQRAFDQREAGQRTQVSAVDVVGWVGALKSKDAAFDLLPLLDKVKRLFLDTQAAWGKRDLTPIRPFLSDATYQRFSVQLKLVSAQGVRDALADLAVLELQLIGLEQSDWFDTVHVRVKAQARDADVPAGASDEEGLAAAKRAPLEAFTEVWTFVRKPGAKTKVGEDLFQGKCPSCGAPFQGGAANKCSFCGAIVNSGNFDWTLSGITQGVEFTRRSPATAGLADLRKADPALNLEMLEDRATLIFWKWVDAHSSGEARRLAKLASAPCLTQVDAELAALKAQRRQKVFLECAIGASTVRALEVQDGFDRAEVEVRWSARMGIGPVGEKPPALPTVPQRWVFSLVRKAGAATNTSNGMSTHRCPQCGGPLTESTAPTCDFCGAELAAGDRDWVLASAASYESWAAAERTKPAATGAPTTPALASASPITDVEERQRLLYMMAAMATADGVVDDSERKLLKLCAKRWSVPWANVELALGAGPGLFDRLVQKGSPEAEAFLSALVEMALIDGKVDRSERRMLDQAAQHLGVAGARLEELLGRR